MLCDKVWAPFNVPIPQLSYHLNLDFARLLPLTTCNNWYVLIMVEHFSKWIELISLLNKFNERVLEQMFS
jgi:hypothetical protein